ncbi:MAG: diphosphomevalonate decarboxylase [Bacteriovoracaceae bacterium]
MSHSTNLPQSFHCIWSSPSNIALIKYWGKAAGVQIPANSSISMTLKKSRTITSMKVELNPDFSVHYNFEGKRNNKFEQKVMATIQRLAQFSPELLKYSYQFESKNTFPHSAGIASSASSMSALALCLTSLRQKWDASLDSEMVFFKEASKWARLGSGSAARSVYPKLAIWGANPAYNHFQNEYAVVEKDIHPLFEGLCDSIVLVDTEEKSVSSTAGHSLMNNHPYRELRFNNANLGVVSMKKILSLGDWDAFCELTEKEALELHSLMMTSSPSFILMKPKTLELIQRLRDYRAQTGAKICFTLDAGPNLHLLYPSSEKAKTKDFINVIEMRDGLRVIHDEMGDGPRLEELYE